MRVSGRRDWPGRCHCGHGKDNERNPHGLDQTEVRTENLAPRGKEGQQWGRMTATANVTEENER